MEIEKYEIGPAYPGFKSNHNEVEIKSKNLLYTEIQDTHVGLQCINLKNHEEIQKRCIKISALIKEIDFLNQHQNRTKI